MFFFKFTCVAMSHSALPLRKSFTRVPSALILLEFWWKVPLISKSVRLASFACKRFSNIIATRFVRIKF